MRSQQEYHTGQVKLKENKPLGATHPRDWLKKGGTLTIETLNDGTQVWKYSMDNVTVPYVPQMVNGEMQNVVKFPNEYLYRIDGIFDGTFKVSEGFTGNRSRDMKNAIKYLDETYGIDEIPKGFVLHHDIDKGVFQLIIVAGGNKMLISKFDNTGIAKEIELFEQKYNFSFPEVYKNFLLKYNGGETPKSKFKIGKITSDIRAFYGFGNADKYYHFDKIQKENRFNAWIQEGVIPIAVNVFGDYVMIGIGNSNEGKIYFFYHDRPSKFIELAENLEAFLNRCKSEKIGHVQTVEERKQKLINNGNEKNITPALIKVWEEQINEYADMHQEKIVLDKGLSQK